MGSYNDDPSMHDIPREDIVIHREVDAVINDFSYCARGCTNADNHSAHLRDEAIKRMRQERGRLIVNYHQNMKAIQADVNRILSGNHDGEGWIKLTLYSIKLALDDAVESFTVAEKLKDSIIEEMKKDGSW